MQVRQVEYNMELLEVFKPNELYQKYHQEILIDFETLYSDFLETELPENLTDVQKANITTQKTNYLQNFVSGHLNTFDPKSKFFKRINEELGETSKSGLILPNNKKLIL